MYEPRSRSRANTSGGFIQTYQPKKVDKYFQGVRIGYAFESQSWYLEPKYEMNCDVDYIGNAFLVSCSLNYSPVYLFIITLSLHSMKVDRKRTTDRILNYYYYCPDGCSSIGKVAQWRPGGPGFNRYIPQWHLVN